MQSKGQPVAKGREILKSYFLRDGTLKNRIFNLYRETHENSAKILKLFFV